MYQSSLESNLICTAELLHGRNILTFEEKITQIPTLLGKCLYLKLKVRGQFDGKEANTNT